MKEILNYNMLRLQQLKLSYKEEILLHYFEDTIKAEELDTATVGGVKFYKISYNKIMEDIPTIGCMATAQRIILRLIKKNIIHRPKESGMRSWFAISSHATSANF